MFDSPYHPTNFLREADLPAPSALRKQIKPLIERLISNPDPKQEIRWACFGPDGEEALLTDLLQAIETLLACQRDAQRIPELEQTIARQEQQIGQHEDQLFNERIGREMAEGRKDSLYKSLFEMEERLEKMQAEIAMCRKHPILLQPKFDPTLTSAQTDWMEQWRAAHGFKTQATLLTLLGDTGIGRQPRIRWEMAQLLGYKDPSTSNITKAIKACEKRGLIEIRKATEGLNGRPPHLIYLTDLGQAAYVMLTNKKPRSSELNTLSSHMTDGHMLLNLEVEQFLAQDGYEILAHGHRHYLDGVRQAVPDITARKDDQISYIEVERNGRKSERAEKWINLCELTSGQIYVFCQSWPLAQEITNEAEAILDQHNLKYQLNVTCLEDCRRHNKIIWLPLAESR